VSSEDHADLQRQIVELRMRMEQQAEAQAALIEHAVSLAVDAKTGGRPLTEAERDWMKEASAAAVERKKIRSAVLLHLVQWGVGGSVGFLLWSAWENFKFELKR
jgi:hypothetical protein